MITLKFSNYEPKGAEFKVDAQAPFIVWQPDLAKIKADFEPSQKYSNLIVIGNGGSIKSLDAIWCALGSGQSDRRLTIVDTMEPDFLAQVKTENPPDKTLVIAISKSGDTVGQLESLLFFADYPVLVVTSPDQGALSQLAKLLGWSQVDYPELGGRFAGRSSVAYGPAHLLGLPIDQIEAGARAAVARYREPDNLAWQLAQFMFDQYQAGKTEIFLPIYSHFLEGFGRLIVQLIHESTGKNEQGPTILVATAPESQHHTNQRFFGGAKNMAGVFLTVESAGRDINLAVPDVAADLSIRDGKLGKLNGESLQAALLAEARGTITDAVEQKIPVAELVLDRITPETIGELLVFWQFVAYYLATLEGVNPFDQPQVERSKEISFKLRTKPTL